jgi:hypothetical protein
MSEQNKPRCLTAPITVTLSPDEIEQCDDFARRIEEHYRSNGDRLTAMPWTRDQMTSDELRQWLASREQAGRVIDIESCELGWWYVQVLDPYGIREALGELSDDEYCVGRDHFVRSPESNGWVWEGDLPADKAKAMFARIEREVAERKASPDNGHFA